MVNLRRKHAYTPTGSSVSLLCASERTAICTPALGGEAVAAAAAEFDEASGLTRADRKFAQSFTWLDGAQPRPRKESLGGSGDGVVESKSAGAKSAYSALWWMEGGPEKSPGK